jgi:hypothetical protein
MSDVEYGPKSFGCVITVKEKSKNKTGPLRQFMVDNDYLYTEVARHVSQCVVCDPAKILGYYLWRRKTIPKFHGQTSGELVKLALKYCKIAQNRGKPLPPELINEFIWRSGSITVYKKFSKILTSREIYEAVILIRDADAAKASIIRYYGSGMSNSRHQSIWNIEQFKPVCELVNAGLICHELGPERLYSGCAATGHAQ